ncbi:MAG: DMT family transporter [Paracoccaceae bacterium]
MSLRGETAMAAARSDGDMQTLDLPDVARTRLIGMLSALTAALFFSVNDMTIKFLSGGYALHQVILIRSFVSLMVLLAVIVPLRGGYGALRTRRYGMHLLRGLCVVIANMFFFLALAALPLGEAVAISFVSPLMITIFSVIFLGESVGPRRWIATGVGFLGVMIVLRPGTEAFQPAALLPLIAAVAYATLQILTRKLGGTDSAVAMTFFIQLTFISVSSAMGLAFGDGRLAGTGDASLDFLFRAWIWPPVSDWKFLLVLGTANALGAFLISQAYRSCEVALIAPFEYAAMPMAIVWGLVIFAEWPDAVAWMGILLILAGGLYLAWREGLAGRRRSSLLPGRRAG